MTSRIRNPELGISYGLDRPFMYRIRRDGAVADVYKRKGGIIIRTFYAWKIIGEWNRVHGKEQNCLLRPTKEVRRFHVEKAASELCERLNQEANPTTPQERARVMSDIDATP